MLTDEQLSCVETACRGHNMAILGQAGTGKTFLAKEIATQLRGLKKNVAITTSTGIAGMQYEFRSSTLHRWSGILDGHCSTKRLLEIMPKEVKTRIAATDVLIIDEVSMVSKQILEQVNDICQHIRGNNSPMGGIQTLVFGDFYQLAPVPNRWVQDSGQYAFESSIWSSLIPHRVVLSTIQRQHDNSLIKAINETARGCPSFETVEYISHLDSEQPRLVKLFSCRDDVHLSNHEELHKMAGDVSIYISEEGRNVSPKMRRTIDAPRHLALKVGAPVILTVNLSTNLVNGLRGKVKHMYDQSVDVYFQDIKQVHNIEPHNFFINTLSHTIFITKQIPLLLAFSMTIHKSQGMTLHSVSIDCSGAFDPGQISVGLGRAQDPTQVTVKNFRASLCPPHPPKVSHYYGTDSKPVDKDLQCCKYSSVCTSEFGNQIGEGENLHDTSTESYSDSGNDDIVEGNLGVDVPDDEGGHAELNVPQVRPQITDLIFHPECPFPLHFTAAVLRNKLTVVDPFTEMELDINDIVCAISDTNLLVWGKYLYSTLWETAIKVPDENKKTKDYNSIIKEFLNTFSKSEEFQQSMKMLFNVKVLSENHVSIGLDAIIRIQDIFFKFQAEERAYNPSTPIYPSPTSSGDAKIRYVAGMCIGKVVFYKTRRLCRNAHKADSNLDYEKLQVKVLKGHIYNTITIAECETKYPSSLSEIRHRQTKYGHLTIVDDDLFELFKAFDKQIYPHLSTHSLHKQKNSLFETILDNAIGYIFADNPRNRPSDLSAHILRPSLVKYLRVCLKEFGIKIVESYHIKKKLAHRKQVMLEESMQKSSPKRMCLPSTSNHHDVLSSGAQCAETSSQHVSETISVLDDRCVQCHKARKPTGRFLWVQCTYCKELRHRKCDYRLKSQKAWKKVSCEGAVYSCPKCSKKKQGDCNLHGVKSK